MAGHWGDEQVSIQNIEVVDVRPEQNLMLVKGSVPGAKRGVVVLKVTNTGTIQHDFKIKGRKTRLLSHGQSATLRVTFLRKGHYPYQCTVAGHAAAGMKGVFTIT